MSAGRPIEYTDERIKEISVKMDEYTDDSDIPILSEFSYINKIRYATLYEHEGLAESRERLFRKKEAQLERLALFNVANATMAIFSLKQLGWKDRHDEKETEAAEGAFKKIAKALIGG